MMNVHIAFDIDKVREMSYQRQFPRVTKCCRCAGESRLGFVVLETYSGRDKKKKYLSDLHAGKVGSLWFHDCVAVAVYFCKKCLEATALCNQA